MKKYLSLFIAVALMVCMIPVSAASDNTSAQLKTVSVTGADLSPAFSSNVYSYDVLVDDESAPLPALITELYDNNSTKETLKTASDLGSTTVIKVTDVSGETNEYKFTYRTQLKLKTTPDWEIVRDESVTLDSNNSTSTNAANDTYLRVYRTLVPVIRFDLTDMVYDESGKFELEIYVSNKGKPDELDMNVMAVNLKNKADGTKNDDWVYGTDSYSTIVDSFDETNVVSFNTKNYSNGDTVKLDISKIIRSELSKGNKKITLTIQSPQASSISLYFTSYRSASKNEWMQNLSYYGIEKSSDASLKSLTVANGIMDKKFSSDIYEYNVGMIEGTAPSFDYLVSESHANAVVNEGTEIGQATTIEVTAHDGTKKTYTFNLVSYEDAGITAEGKVESEDVFFSTDTLNPSENITLNLSLKNKNTSPRPVTVIYAIKDNDKLTSLMINTVTLSTGINDIPVSITTPADVTKAQIDAYVFDKTDKELLGNKISLSNMSFTPSVTTADKEIAFKVNEAEGKIKFYGIGDPNTSYPFFVTYPQSTPAPGGSGGGATPIQTFALTGEPYDNLTTGEMSSVLAAFDVVTTNAQGIWECDVNILENSLPYSAYIYDGQAVSEPLSVLYVSAATKYAILNGIYDIIYPVSETPEATILADLKTALDLSDIDPLNNTTDILGISSLYNASLSEDVVIKALYSLIKEKSPSVKLTASTVADLADFSDLFTKALILAKLNTGTEISVASLISDFAFTDLTAIYALLPSTRLGCVEPTLVGKNINKSAELKSLLKTNILLDAFSNPENVSLSQSIIETYETDLSLDLTTYNLLTNKSTIVSYVVNDGPYTDKTVLSDKLNYYITNYGEFSTGGGGGGGGGAGGGSGSGTGTGSGLTIDSSTVGTGSSGIYTDEIESSVNIAPQKVFSDVGTTHWTYGPTKYLSQKGIVSGVGNGNYEPERSVTREEFTKIICEAFDLKDSESDIEFNDVDKNSWYYEYVRIAVANGAILGVSDTDFGSGTGLKRQDAAVILMRVLKLSAEETENFGDDTEIADYAKEAVYTLKAMGILNGTGEGNFEPERAVTRAECAKIIYELIKE